MTYASVGDSRIYRLRAGVLRQLTRDDTWANVDWPGSTLPAGGMKNVLTKAIGARDEVEFDVYEDTLESGDLIMICSDGLTGMLSDDRMLAIASADALDVEAACERLLAEASAEGGRDNISVILIRYER
jgi:serine/threonine protein phosphatase PrpC